VPNAEYFSGFREKHRTCPQRGLDHGLSSRQSSVL